MSPSTTNPAWEQLESRIVLSASSAMLLQDLQAIQDARSKFVTDRISILQTLRNDSTQLVVDGLNNRTAVAQLLKSLQTQFTAERQTLASDGKTGAATVFSDAGVIAGDVRSFVLDRGNVTAQTNDRAKLTADRIKLVSDITANKTALFNDRAFFTTQIKQVKAQILSARLGDSGAVAADKVKIKTDRNAAIATLGADELTIRGAQTKYRQDRIG